MWIGTQRIDGPAFRDPDRDDLNHQASSLDATVAAVELDGTVLTVRGVARGTAEVTLTAADGNGGTASQTFAVTVTGPEVVWFLPSASDPVREGFVRVVNHSERGARPRPKLSWTELQGCPSACLTA